MDIDDVQCRGTNTAGESRDSAAGPSYWSEAVQEARRVGLDVPDGQTDRVDARIPTGSPKLCSVRESSTRRIRLGRSAQSASPSFAEVLDRKGDLYTRTETLVLQLRLLENSRDGQV